MSDAPRSDVLDALVVGCGRIAGGYEAGGDTEAVLTHAGAYQAHPGFRLSACVDPDAGARHRFMTRWNVAAGFASIAEWQASGAAVDVASLCAPTGAHAECLRALLEAPVRAVLCEKPLAEDAETAAAIVSGYRAAAKPLAVNYLRRWAPGLRALADEIAAGAWGEVQIVTGFYGKGLFNAGSHLLDLARFLFGPMELDCVLGVRDDGRATDPTIDALLRTPAGAPVYLLGSDHRHYALFEMSIVAAEGRIDLEGAEGTLRIRRAAPLALYPELRGPGPAQSAPTGLDRAMYYAVDDLYRAVTEGVPVGCSGETALATLRLCQVILEQVEAEREDRP